MRKQIIVAAAVIALAACTSQSPEPAPSNPTAAETVPSATTLTGTDDAGWRMSSELFSAKNGIEGYANRVSVLPGQPVTLFVSSSTPTFTITAYRMTGTTASKGLKVWSSPTLHGGKQTAIHHDASTRSTWAAWKPTTTVSTDGWSEGVYLFKLRASNRKQSVIPLVVRSASTAGKVVLAMSALTWQAYNTWGGKSSYNDDEGTGFSHRAYAMSFDRPYANGYGSGKYLEYENPAVLRAEALKIPLAYETDIDVATIPGLLDGALGYVSMGHDEYWTGSQRTAVEAARDKGTNLAFLGANVSYWQVRLREAPSGPNRIIDIYKSTTADPVKGGKATVNFRDLGRPENQMTGQMYECYPARGDYTVLNPKFFLFAGTGAKAGSTYSKIEGIEVDRANPISTTPRPLEVVAKSKVTCGKGHTWSTSSYYTVASGAGVFTTGTMGWVMSGLSSKTNSRTRTFVGKVTDNLLRAMAAGPMGKEHPATDNLDSLGLSTSLHTGSA